MTERDKILARIREALTVKAPLPGHPRDGNSHLTAVAVPSAHANEWLPPTGDSFEAQFTAFQQNAAILKADFFPVNNSEELKKRLLALRDTEGWKKIAFHSGTLTVFAAQNLGVPAIQTDSGYAVHELEQCDAGISECDALVAQTGTAVVTSRSAGGRALSVLPPHHVVLARREQLVRDLPAAFTLLRQKYAANYPSMILFITGPSRTSDIERILVLGAHGPKKLTIFLL